MFKSGVRKLYARLVVFTLGDGKRLLAEKITKEFDKVSRTLRGFRGNVYFFDDRVGQLLEDVVGALGKLLGERCKGTRLRLVIGRPRGPAMELVGSDGVVDAVASPAISHSRPDARPRGRGAGNCR